MLKRVKSIFKGQNDPLKSFDASNKNEILNFEEKLNQIAELPQNDQVIGILQLSTTFTNLFGSFNSQQINNERISKIYNNYLKYITDLSEVIFEVCDKNYEYIFRNLKLIGNQLGSIPNSSNFVQFFYQILRTAKSGDMDCLRSSSSFSCFLFKDEKFFKAFSIEFDGLTSIFTSFFIAGNKEAMPILMELLFSIVPDNFYSIPSPTLLAVCKDAMNSDNCPECALFLCNYLALLSSNSPEDATESFYNEDGFTSLNHFLVTHCDKSTTKECYEILLLKKGKPTKFTLKGLYGIYCAIPDYQEFSLELLRKLKHSEIQGFLPIHAWILNENEMKEESVVQVFSIMLQMGITNYVDNIFTIIEKYPSYKKHFLELIYVSLNEKNCDPSNLIEPKQIPYPKSTTPVTTTIENSFLNRFVVKVDQEQLKTSMLDESKYFREILLAAYSCPKSAKIREEVLSKLINIYDIEKLTTIMIELLEVDITSEIFALLLSNLTNPFVNNLLIYSLENHLSPFDYEFFISLNGLSNFEILLEENKQNEKLSFFASNIIKIIELFTKNGPKNEIDEWILTLPNDSVLFDEKNHNYLAKVAINDKTMFLNVPSLLLFAVLVRNKSKDENDSQKKKPLFDVTSPVCLYNAGKYGIPMFLKRGMKITESLPFYEAIINRYINPTIYNEIAEDYDHYPNFVNSDEFTQSVPLNFELYELYLSGYSDTTSSVTFKDIEKNGSASNPIKSIDFRFFVPPIYDDLRVSILKCDCLEIEYFNGVLVFRTNYRTDSSPARINKRNTFIRIKCLFYQGRAIIKAWFEKISEFIHDDEDETKIKPIEKSLEIDNKFPHFISLGGRYSSAKSSDQKFPFYRIIFDRYIFINNRIALYDQLNGNAYKVPYHGFYSYMIKERTRMFLILEELQNTPSFTQVYIAILMMIKYLNNDLYDNNGISFATYISEKSSKVFAGFSDEISKEYLFSRLLFSLKRSVSSISDNMLVYFHQLPYTILNEEDFADFTYIILIDFEIYFLFDKQLIVSYLKLVKNDIQQSKVLVDKLINYKTSSFLVSIIKRSYELINISDDILDLVYSILIHLESENYASLNALINEAVVVSYWKFHFMIDTFSAGSIMELQQVESPLQVSFLNTIKKILQSLKDAKINANLFVQYSLFFNDERSLIFFEIMANYSYHVLNYVDPSKSPYLNYAFARFADNEKAWLIAFTILGGFPEVLTEFPSSLTIKIPKFSSTILVMLIRLLSLQTLSVFKGDDEIQHKELAEKVFASLMSIPLNDFTFFSTDLALISLLSNFGIIPASIQMTFDSERTKYKMNDEEIKMTSFDFSTYKDIEIFKDKELLSSSMECFKLPEFPDNLVNCEWVNMLDFTRLISFITKIVLSTDFSNFAQIAVGNALMYTAYQKKFAKELIFSILTHYQNITKSESFLKKSVSNFMQVVSTAARCSVFSDCYLKFLDKVIAFLKTWCVSKKIDPSYYAKDFRDIIIYSIHFIIDDNECSERNKLLKDNKDIIFNQQMNENLDYVSIVNAYIFNESSQSKTTLAVEKYSQIELLITNNFKINEFPSLPIPGGLETESASTIMISSISNSRCVRVLNGKKILEWTESFLRESSRGALFIKALKTAYVYQSILYQFDHIQVYCRVLEQKLFRCIKDEYIYHQNYSSFDKEEKDSKFVIKSYYLSQISEPYYSPRNVFPSPFEIKSPPNDEKTKDFSVYMPNKNVDINSKIHYVDFFGQLMFPYQWCQDLSIFKHSYVFTPGGSDSENHPFYDISHLIDSKTNAFKYSSSNASKEVKKTILRDFIRIFGTFSYCLEVDLLYYVHKIPSLLFIQEDKIILFILSTKKNFLMKYYQHSLLLIPLNQQVLLNEYHDTSIFCGHYALSFFDRRFIRYDEHYYSHEKKSLSLFYKCDPNIVIVFKSTKDLDTLVTKKYNLINRTNSNNLIYMNENFYNGDTTNYNFNLSINNFNVNRIRAYRMNNQKTSSNINVNYSFIQSLPHNSFFFVSTPPKDIILYWLEHEISSFDYLVFLNLFSSRSFLDLAQYPVFPWVCTPINNKLKMRDLSKPMGQISEERAQHFDDIYEGMKDESGYFYGCHYSNPAIVIWYLIRLPPFNYLTWELNNGWDAKSRQFKSITAAYISASTTNPTDVKELIPEMYSIPMSLTNESHLNCLPSIVKLPTNQDNKEISSSLFISMNRKYLEESSNLNNWIDLIFGYKQSGPEALKSKNIFLPTAYHNSTPEANMMDKDVFEAHVNNFGQCPTQLIKDKSHPSRTERVTKSAEDFIKTMTIVIPYSTWCFYHLFFNVNKIEVKEKIKLNRTRKRSSTQKNTMKSKILRSMTKTDTDKKVTDDEPSTSYSFHLSLSSRTSEINDHYFISSGIDQFSKFIHFISNDKKEGSSSACGDIEIRWKLVNTEGLIVPIRSVPIIPNNINKYMDQNLLSTSSSTSSPSLSPSSSSSQQQLQQQQQQTSSNDALSLSFANPWNWFIGASSPSEDLRDSCFVISYERDEIITIRKIINSKNHYISRYFKNINDENVTTVKNNAASNSFNSSSELIAAYKDIDGYCLNHISVSNDGLYIVASYDNGIVKVFRIEYDKVTPQRIYLVNFFTQNSEVLLSKVSSRDMLVFSVLNNGKLIFWSFATRLKHREFDLGIGKKSICSGINHKPMDNSCTKFCDVVDVINDDFDGCVTVLLIDRILQFSSNGTSVLREFVLKQEQNDENYSSYFTSIALYPLDFSFDQRILIVGDNNGTLYFFAVSVPDLGKPDLNGVEVNDDENNDKESESDLDVVADNVDEKITEIGSLVLVGIHKNLLKSQVSSIFVDKHAGCIIANDQRGGSIVLKMDPFILYNKIDRCDKCLNEKIENCKQCGAPICPFCSNSGMCNNCRDNSFSTSLFL